MPAGKLTDGGTALWQHVLAAEKTVCGMLNISALSLLQIRDIAKITVMRQRLKEINGLRNLPGQRCVVDESL